MSWCAGSSSRRGRIVASRECAVQRAMAQVGGIEQLAIHSILYGEKRDAATALSFAASFAAPAVSFSGPSFGFGTSFAPAEFASSSSMSTNVLSFPDHLTGRRVSLVLVADGKLQPPAQLRAQIKRALELMKTATWFFAQRSPGIKRLREEAPPPLSVDLMLTEFSLRVPVRLMFGCVAIACRRLATAPAGVHVFCKTMGRWAAWIMERVTRGRVRRVQETLAGFQAAAAARVPDYYRHWIGHSAESGDGYAVLCHAIAYADDVKICVNKRDYRHRTPLQESAKQGHLEICRLLIQCNADIEAKGWDGWTPLISSAARGRLAICRLLVESKADVAVTTSCGTALQWAIISKNADVARYLRSIGAPQ